MEQHLSALELEKSSEERVTPRLHTPACTLSGRERGMSTEKYQTNFTGRKIQVRTLRLRRTLHDTRNRNLARVSSLEPATGASRREEKKISRVKSV